MDFAEVICELKAFYIDQLGYLNPTVPGLTEADVQRWSAWIGSRAALYDQIALYLARGFQSSELTFAFCDAIINHLHWVIIRADDRRPELFWAIFLAFEEGESNHRGENPIEVYVRPAIARILESGTANVATPS